MQKQRQIKNIYSDATQKYQFNILPTSSVYVTLSSNMHKSQNFRNTLIENTLVRENKNTNETTEASTVLKRKH